MIKMRTTPETFSAFGQNIYSITKEVCDTKLRELKLLLRHLEMATLYGQPLQEFVS